MKRDRYGEDVEERTRIRLQLLLWHTTYDASRVATSLVVVVVHPPVRIVYRHATHDNHKGCRYASPVD
ncbi:MAG: hypothetical protein NVSMB44_09760 [Ktedonobacteraceae bacterium]